MSKGARGELRTISRKLTMILAGLLLILTVASPVTASALSRINSPTQLTNPVSVPFDGFGWSVAVGGGLVLVGSPYTPASGGSASVFSARTGGLLFTLTSPMALISNLGNEFGWSVAMSDGLLVVSAPGEMSIGHVNAYGGPIHGGNAYVFNARTGDLVYMLTSPNPNDEASFGWSVGVGNGVIVVGAPDESSGGQALAGNVYVFDTQTGGLLFTLTSPTPQSFGGFGWSTSVASGLIVVGAPYEENIYAFNDHTGGLLFTLASPDKNPPGAGGIHFGWSVSVGEGLIVVGAPEEGASFRPGPIFVPGPGSAYVFNAHVGSLQSRLTSDLFDARFGESVSVGGGQIVVGAPYGAVAGHPAAGTAYVYNARTDDLLSTLTSPNPQTKATFGWSVGVNDALVVVGAPIAIPCDPRQGFPCGPDSAYIF